MKRLLVLRNKVSNKWKTAEMAVSDFDSRKFKGWQLYRSFSLGPSGRAEAQAYAKQVEADEKRIIALNPHLA